LKRKRQLKVVLLSRIGGGKLLDTGKKQPLEVKQGDKVLFGKYAGTDIQVEGVEHLIMREDDIIAIIE
jgi:chaperonin GroES